MEDSRLPLACGCAGLSGYDVSIVIITYNSADWIRRCVESIHGGCDGLRTQVIVADNASTDSTLNVVAGMEVDCTLRFSENLGFARAANCAVNHAVGNYVVLLNPDAYLHNQSVTNLLAFAESFDGQGVFGGRAFSPAGHAILGTAYGLPTLWSAACFALGLNSAFPRNRFLDPESLGSWDRDTERVVGLVTGCLLAIRRTAWEQLGGLDERFFMYSEDADLAVRARKLGLLPRITPDARVTHAVAASSASAADRWILVLAGRCTFYLKHFTARKGRVARFLLLVGVIVRCIGSRLLHRDGDAPAAWAYVLSQRGRWYGGYPALSVND